MLGSILLPSWTPRVRHPYNSLLWSGRTATRFVSMPTIRYSFCPPRSLPCFHDRSMSDVASTPLTDLPSSVKNEEPHPRSQAFCEESVHERRGMGVETYFRQVSSSVTKGVPGQTLAWAGHLEKYAWVAVRLSSSHASSDVDGDEYECLMIAQRRRTTDSVKRE